MRESYSMDYLELQIRERVFKHLPKENLLSSLTNDKMIDDHKSSLVISGWFHINEDFLLSQAVNNQILIY